MSTLPGTQEFVPECVLLTGPSGLRASVTRGECIGLKGLMFFRLWHQLTLQVLDFVQDPCFAQGDGLIKVNDLSC